MFKRHILGISLLLAFLIPLGAGMGEVFFENSSSISFHNSNIGSSSNFRARIDQGNDVAFDIGSFSSSSETNLTRMIVINDWGAVTINDTLNVNVSNSFNSIDIYFSNEIADFVHYQGNRLLNSSEPTEIFLDTAFVNPFNATTTNYHFKFSQSVTSIKISFFFNLVDQITTNKDELGGNSDVVLPYKFNASSLFYPWYSIPLNSYEVYAGTKGEIGEQNVRNTTMIPNQDNIDGDLDLFRITGETYLHYTLDGILSFNYSSLGSYGYNLENLANHTFIPSFHSDFVDVMAQEIVFDLYFNAAYIEFLKVDSTVEVNPWGSTYHTEVITLKNKGVSGARIGGPGETGDPAPIVIYYPTTLDNIIELEARDSLGNLTRSDLVFRSDEDGYAKNITAIRVVPRISIKPDETYTFTLKYAISNKLTLNETGGFLAPSWKLNIPILSMFNWTVRDLSVKIIFPVGTSVGLNNQLLNTWLPGTYETISSPAPFGFDLIGLGRPTIQMSFNSVSPIRNVVLAIDFSLPPVFGWFLQPLLTMLFIFGLGVIFVVIRSLSFRLSPVVSSTREKDIIPFDLIEGFVQYYQEKTALRQRMNDLVEKRNRLKKVDFDKQKQTLETKATNVDRDLLKYTQALSDQGGRYRDAVRQIEIAEATRDDILRNLTDLNKKKRQKRMRPEIHARLQDDYTKKLKKANTTIERVLVDLRSLLTDRS